MIKVINYWFIALVVSLIFCNIPKNISLEFLGNNMGDKLSLYLIIIALIFFIFKIIKHRNRLIIPSSNDVRILIYYFIILIIIQIISLIIGIINYPYYELLQSNINILPTRFLTFFSSDNTFLGSTLGLQIYLLFKGVKNLILNSIWLFGGAILVYISYLYIKSKQVMNAFLSQEYIKKLLIGIYISLGILFIYALVELPFLLGYKWAESILTAINPYIHQIGNLDNIYLGKNIAGEKAYSWWPPLLWKNQVRSIFPEPSFFGVYCSFAIPWIWYAFIKAQNRSKILIIAIVLLLISLLVFLTQSRTAILLLIGECLLLFTYIFYKFNSGIVKKIVSIFIITCISWGASVWLISMENEQKPDKLVQYSIKAEQYVKENIKSVNTYNERSNKARYSLMQAELSVWKQHSLFGVGPGMKASYLTEKFDDDALKDQEVRMWVRRIIENGPLKAGYPNVSAYTVTLSELGLIGFIIYFLPCIYLIGFFILYLFRNRKSNTNDLTLPIFFYLISLTGVLISGLTTSLTATYCLWILLGLGLILRRELLN